VADLPGREMPSGFDYSIPWDESPFALTYEEQKAWDEWLADNRRCHMRAMEAASNYVVGGRTTPASFSAHDARSDR
jgi:hypothetical protein